MVLGRALKSRDLHSTWKTVGCHWASYLLSKTEFHDIRRHNTSVPSTTVPKANARQPTWSPFQVRPVHGKVQDGGRTPIEGRTDQPSHHYTPAKQMLIGAAPSEERDLNKVLSSPLESQMTTGAVWSSESFGWSSCVGSRNHHFRGAIIDGGPSCQKTSGL